MARNKRTGEKTTETRAGRRHSKVVDQAIHEQESRPDGRMAPATSKRYDATFNHMHRAHNRFLRRWS